METGTATISENVSGDSKLSGSCGQGTRLVIYSHDTFGLGHIQRCLKISRVLTARFPQLSILLVTGSLVSHRYEFPPRVDYVKLPSVRKAGPERYEARNLTTSFDVVLRLRSELVLKSVQGFEPHIFLVDHSPIGMKGELLPVLNWLKTSRKNTVTVLGLRDIIDSPEAVRALWKEKEIYDVLESSYDHILIYGTQSVYDPPSAYNFSDNLRQKTIFCNYVGEVQRQSRPLAAHNDTNEKRPLVVVTIGGGDGAGEMVVGNFIKMLQINQEKINFDSVIITGPFLPRDLLIKYRKAARDLPVSIKTFMPSTASLIKRSDLVIATGGYNTVTDILSFAKRAIVIPRVMHRQEQRIRAQRMADLGIIKYLAPEQLTPERLFANTKTLLDSCEEPVAKAREKNLISLDGATRLADLFSQIFKKQTNLKVGRA